MEKAELLFRLCSFEESPVEKKEYVKRLRECLDEVPATVSTKDVELAKEAGVEDVSEVDGGDTGTSPLHKVCESFKLEWSEDEKIMETALGLIDNLFYYGANWMMLDDNNETPGCIALRRGLPDSIYQRFVAAGVRAEVFLRKIKDMMVDDEDEVEDEDVEVADDDEEESGDKDKADTEPSAEVVDETEKTETEDKIEVQEENGEQSREGDTAQDQTAYLSSSLQYEDGRLVTENQKDGVMMDWETPIMEKSAEIICTAAEDPASENIVLNVGFGMGIIDTIIEDKYHPTKHYISEAHPDVLAKLKTDGWYERPNVVILEGRWQDTLPSLISQGVNFDGIYYDTFSEHYQDMLEFFDLVVALLKPTGVFSFFNGLGADRQICYDVYKQVVELDMQDYGFEVSYTAMPIDDHQADQTWDGIRRPYWTLKEFLLPKIKFLTIGI
ncbi:Rmt2p [Sugiyamaella lignohabitans]|uniref:Arginine N-methyltransferase 2 n=1 Tax=Sugiyamaella lignohabitans TaxID=796027 RepID=A0A161HGE0_9ASCO|nr:Rmt2p [Sugiyamaella lignohabitans]ANB14790.1 Rmt2p [Sugiyamaella lignohabitans]